MSPFTKLRERMERYRSLVGSDDFPTTFAKLQTIEQLMLDTMETVLNEREKQAAAHREDTFVPLPSMMMKPGCCSAISPCSHQQQDPSSLCSICDPNAVKRETFDAVAKQAKAAHDVYTIPRASKLRKQVGGDHYVNMAIQPLEYILANNIPFAEGAAIKYISRWRAKGGVQDLRKAIQTLEVIIEHEEAKAARGQS
jgi:hypothetical protein